MFRSLRARILAGYGATLALTVLVLAVAVTNVRRLEQAAEDILLDNYRSVLAADRMVDAIERQDSGVRMHVTRDLGGRAQAEQHADSFAVWFDRAAANVTEPGEGRAVARLDSSYRAYRRIVGALDAAPDRRAAYRRAARPAFLAVRAEATRLREINQRAMYAASERATTVGRRARATTLGIGLAAVAAGLAFSLWLAGWLVRPLDALRRAADRIGRGDYDAPLPPAADDEIGALAEAMGAMARQLRDVRTLDVQQLVAEKRRTEAVLDAVADGVVVVDGALRVEAANPAAERLLGGLPRGLALDVLTARGPFAGALADVRSAVAENRPFDADDAPRLVEVDVDGRTRIVQCLVTPMGAVGGAAVLLLRDLTALQEAERLRGEFITAASHELRTPLTGMEMALGMLRRPVAERLDARDQDLFQVLLDEQGRLTVLVADLLDLARMEAGQADLYAEPLDVGALLDETAARFAAQAAAQGATVAAEPRPPLPPVQADAARLALVLSNLVANALRHVGPGGHVGLSAHADGGAVTFSVADDGPGIPPEARERIFDALAQVRDGRPLGSSGLGLAICRAIVRAHGGTIRAEPAPGGGAAFVVDLPAV